MIDVGTNRTDDGLVGDVDFDAVREVAGAITPVPGGVGPMTRRDAAREHAARGARRRVRLARTLEGGQALLCAAVLLPARRASYGSRPVRPSAAGQASPAAALLSPARRPGDSLAPGAAAPARRRSAGDTLRRAWICEGCAPAEWLAAAPASRCCFAVPALVQRTAGDGLAGWEALAVIDVALALVAACGRAARGRDRRRSACRRCRSRCRRCVTLVALVGALLVAGPRCRPPGRRGGREWAALARRSPAALASRSARALAMRGERLSRGRQPTSRPPGAAPPRPSRSRRRAREPRARRRAHPTSSRSRAGCSPTSAARSASRCSRRRA